IERRREQRRRQNVADCSVAPEPHHQITGGALLKEVVWQVHEVIEKTQRKCSLELSAKLNRQVFAKESRERTGNLQAAVRGGNQQEQRIITARNDAVDQYASQ